MSGETEESERPYTVGSFQTKLDQFHELMKEITLQDVEATPEEKRQMITENLRYDQFCDAIRQLFGSDIKNQDLKALYRKISTNPDAKIDWSELFGYIQTSAEEAEEIMVGEEVSIFTVSKRRRVGEAAGDKKRRDTVQCLRYVPSLDSYISCSQKGALALWSSKLRLQACIDINEAAWVTGCDYLPSIRRASCCTERSIIIWDNRSKGKNQHVFAIKPFDHAPQCMVSVPKPGAIHEEVILFGDDQGYLNILTVAAKDLTMKNSKGGEKKPVKDQNILHVIEPNRLTVPMVRRKVHDDWVTRVRYFPELHCFASCSPSSKTSFVLEELDRIHDNQELRGVSVHKGVNAFDYCAKANIIATGGVDKVIRVWHPHIFSRPTGKLLGHLFTIVDICCNERDQHIISLSTARVFRVWDIHTLTSLQVFTDNEERPGEKRIYSMLFDNKHERLLTGSSVIDSWPLTRAVQDTMQVPHTHDRPLSQLVFNKDLGQVVTVCTESVLKVWEMESGKLVYTITDAHKGSIEITALTLDSSGYRLASGAFDGSIKIWDFGSGQCIKEKAGRASDEDLSITGLMYSKLEDDRVLIASGWNNKLKILLDTNENYDLPVIREFNDIYYYTQDLGMPATAQSFDPFKQDPLPDIKNESQTSRRSSTKASEKDDEESRSRPQTFRGMSNHQMSNLFKKDYILMSNEISCTTTFESNILLTGCTNGNIIQWDIEKSCVDKVFQLPEGEQPTNGSRQQSRTSSKSSDKKINSIKILVHKTRRLDPAYIKKELSFHESTKGGEDEAEKGADKGASTERETSATTDEEVEKHEKDKSEKEGERNKDDDDEEDDSEDKSDSDEEEKKDEEKSVHDEDEDPEVLREKENAAKYIVETYDPVIVTVHQDAYIRFWNTEGHVLREITAVTRRQGTAVTAVCHDADCNIMITGDHKGYLTLWDIGKFLSNPESEEQELVKQVICWRAHLTKVVSLTYIDSVKAILSASTDGSARVWWGRKGRFVGFFGQHRIFTFPTSEEKAGPPTLPYDITEGPLAPVKTKSAIQKIRPVQKYEYPLIFDEDRWQPFKRSAYLNQTQERKKLDPQDKKFFEALIKPKAYNYHLEGVAPGRKRDGAVFRALPVYRVRTPDVPKTPPLSFRGHVDVSDGPQPKRSTVQQPNQSRDKRGLSTNNNSRFSTPVSRQRQPHMQKLYLQIQEKQKSKASKEGSSTSFSVKTRRRSLLGRTSAAGHSSVLSMTTGTPMLPPIAATASTPRI